MASDEGYNKEHPEIRFRTNRVIHKALLIRLKRLGCKIDRYANQLFHVAMSDDGTIKKAEDLVEQEIRDERNALPPVAHKRRQSYTFSLPTEFVRKIDEFRNWMSRSDFLMTNLKWDVPGSKAKASVRQRNPVVGQLWTAMSVEDLYSGEVPC